MKKFFAMLMSLVLCMGMAAFAACSTEPENVPGDDAQMGGQTPEQGGSQEEGAGNEQTGDDEDTDDETPDETPSGESNVLIVYFSATGNTETIAGYIADATGGTIFELVPVDPYTSEDLNYGNRESRVYREYLDESLRNVELVSATPENWEAYDTVFIGYPIWWGIAAWPVNNFVTENDFTGKTVIPFCTSASSGLGQSGELLAEAAGTGNWLEGMRFRSSASENDVRTWIENLNIV